VTDINDIFHRTPPQRLYHYTTQRGLLGILDSKEMWATHTQYLNDQREFRHAISLVKDELHTMRADSARHNDHGLLELMEKVVDGMGGINVCVCSFSEIGDSLSQWRAYGESASGFSIGFSGAFLRSVSEDQNFWLVPVLYDESEQRELVRDVLNRFLAESVSEPARIRAFQIHGYLNRYAPILKHHSFSEEREWRIVSHPLQSTHERFGYPPGTSMLVPHFRIPLTSPQRPLAIEEVLVGPTPHSEQSERSVSGVLIRHGLMTPVRQSEVPYRNW